MEKKKKGIVIKLSDTGKGRKNIMELLNSYIDAVLLKCLGGFQDEVSIGQLEIQDESLDKRSG